MADNHPDVAETIDSAIPRIIWICWFQGTSTMPPLVRHCVNSWIRHNPTWEVRFVDAATVQSLVDLSSVVDLDHQTVTAASVSDALRLLLLDRYGGVWVDATVLCNQPLDSWLHTWTPSGFFAFARPRRGAALSSWFLASEPGHLLTTRWLAEARSYWSTRKAADEYFWAHQCFKRLLDGDAAFASGWASVPEYRAAGPHSMQAQGRMYMNKSTIATEVDWLSPVFKLSYRIDEDQVRYGSLLADLLSPTELVSGLRTVVGQRPIGPIAPSSALPPRVDLAASPFDRSVRYFAQRIKLLSRRKSTRAGG